MGHRHLIFPLSRQDQVNRFRRLSVTILITLLSGCGTSSSPSQKTTGIETPLPDSSNINPSAVTAHRCSQSQQHSGRATFYQADGSGHCSFPTLADPVLVGALNPVDYAGGNLCGSCVEIQGPNGRVMVKIVDSCPECDEGDIDLSEAAFKKIADLNQGIVDISWQPIACETHGPVRYFFKSGSNPWWAAIQVRNHRNALTSLAVQNSKGQFKPLQRTDYNFFLAESGLGQGPFTLKITDIHGQSLIDHNLTLSPAQEQPGQNQLPSCRP